MTRENPDISTTWPLLACIFSVAICLASCQLQPEPMPFQMTYDPARVTKGLTRDITLRCEKDPTVPAQMQEVDRIRILKQTPAGWTLLAQKRDVHDEAEAHGAGSAEGTVSTDLDDMYLEVTWDLATEETFGVFVCDVIGFDETFMNVMHRTTEVEITNTEASEDDLLELILGLKKDVNDEISHKLQDGINEIQSFEFERMSDLRPLLEKEYLSFSAMASWPGGHYGLLQPKTGCPVDFAFYGGDTGFIEYVADPTVGTDSNRPHFNSHLMQQTYATEGADQGFSLHFCVVTRSFNSNRWPDGMFCIHRSGGSCPDASFESGFFSADIEDIGHEGDMHGSFLPDTENGKFLFCCKRSQRANVPMALPTHSPFYLYRYGGECQQVEGMDVVEEVAEMNGKGDGDPNNEGGAHPDIVPIAGKWLEINLCYYNKRNDVLSINERPSNIL